MLYTYTCVLEIWNLTNPSVRTHFSIIIYFQNFMENPKIRETWHLCKCGPPSGLEPGYRSSGSPGPLGLQKRMVTFWSTAMNFHLRSWLTSTKSSKIFKLLLGGKPPRPPLSMLALAPPPRFNFVAPMALITGINYTVYMRTVSRRWSLYAECSYTRCS